MKAREVTQLVSISAGTLPQLLPIALKYRFSGKMEAFSAAIDITSACNLRCKHCYVYRDEKVPYEMNRWPQLSDEQWLMRIRKLKEEHPHIVHATWVGGEPLMRKSLLKRGIKLFKYNWVVTNGTLPIPSDLSNTAVVVSLDGRQEHHDELRGAGRYQTTKKNVMKTNAVVFAHMVITSKNKDSVSPLLEEWCKTDLRGIRFSFYSPEYNVDDPLWLQPEERDTVVDKLLALKRQFGSFLWMSTEELEAMKSEHQNKVFGENCLLKRGADISLDAQGKIKKPCVMGEKTDCSRCGCTVPAMLYAILEKNSLAAAMNVAKKLCQSRKSSGNSW